MLQSCLALPCQLISTAFAVVELLYIRKICWKEGSWILELKVKRKSGILVILENL